MLDGRREAPYGAEWVMMEKKVVILPVNVRKEKVAPVNPANCLALMKIAHTSPLKGIVDQKIDSTVKRCKLPKEELISINQVNVRSLMKTMK